jgi:hypothetical protein
MREALGGNFAEVAGTGQRHMYMGFSVRLGL